METCKYCGTKNHKGSFCYECHDGAYIRRVSGRTFTKIMIAISGACVFLIWIIASLGAK